MCRFLAYMGAPLLLADVLYRPANSLVTQSHKARDMDETLNGDGFGIGWYVPEIDPTPCIQRTILPAWASYNLQSLAAKVRASCFFAHVRAASPGMMVTDTNVHPFSYDSFMWMHNGGVAGFSQVKRLLRASLKDEFYEMIQGTTDSEHCFAVFLNNLNNVSEKSAPVDLRRALIETISQINNWTREAGINEPSFYNFAVTDNKSIVVSRSCSAAGVKSRSLYYTRNLSFADFSLNFDPTNKYAHHDMPPAVIVSSERLTDENHDWVEIPDNHTITIRENLSIEIEKIVL